jgi:hypothetical protein
MDYLQKPIEVLRSLLKSKKAKGERPRANAKEAQSPKKLSPKSFNLRHSRVNGNPVRVAIDIQSN